MRNVSQCCIITRSRPARSVAYLYAYAARLWPCLWLWSLFRNFCIPAPTSVWFYSTFFTFHAACTRSVWEFCTHQFDISFGARFETQSGVVTVNWAYYTAQSWNMNVRVECVLLRPLVVYFRTGGSSSSTSEIEYSKQSEPLHCQGNACPIDRKREWAFIAKYTQTYCIVVVRNRSKKNDMGPKTWPESELPPECRKPVP